MPKMELEIYKTKTGHISETKRNSQSVATLTSQETEMPKFTVDHANQVHHVIYWSANAILLWRMQSRIVSSDLEHFSIIYMTFIGPPLLLVKQETAQIMNIGVRDSWKIHNRQKQIKTSKSINYYNYLIRYELFYQKMPSNSKNNHGTRRS